MQSYVKKLVCLIKFDNRLERCQRIGKATSCHEWFITLMINFECKAQRPLFFSS